MLYYPTNGCVLKAMPAVSLSCVEEAATGRGCRDAGLFPWFPLYRVQPLLRGAPVLVEDRAVGKTLAGMFRR